MLDPTSSTSRYLLRDTTALTVGTLVSGVAAYGYIALGTRAYGASGFAAVSVLWTFWAISAAVITFPIQHWVIRTIEADASEGRVRSAIPSILWATAVISLLIGLASWYWRNTLFVSSEFIFPVFVTLIPFGSMVVGLSRGGLAARGRFAATGAAIAGENVMRLLLGGIVLALGLEVTAFALALIAGFAISLAWPSALTYRASGFEHQRVPPLVFMSGVAGGTLIMQIVLTGGPIALAMVGGAPAEVTALFSALAIFRAPYMLSTGLAVRITGSLTRLVLGGNAGQIRRLYWIALVVGVAAPMFAAGFGLTAGPSILTFVFGETVTLPGGLVAIVAAGSAMAVIALFYMLVLLASGRVRLITTTWLVGGLSAIVWVVLGGGTPIWRVASAFTIAELVALGGMLISTREASTGKLGSIESHSPRVPPRKL